MSSYYNGFQWIPIDSNAPILQINPVLLQENMISGVPIQTNIIEDHLDELNNQSTINQTFYYNNEYVTPLEYLFKKMKHYGIYEKSEFTIFLTFFQPKYKWNIREKSINIFLIIFDFFRYLDTEDDNIDSYIINTILDYFFENYKSKSLKLLKRRHRTFDGECVNEKYKPIYLLSSKIRHLSKENFNILFPKNTINHICYKETIDGSFYATKLQCLLQEMFPNYLSIKRLVLNGADIFQTYNKDSISAFDYLQYLNYNHDDNVKIKKLFYDYKKWLLFQEMSKNSNYYIHFLNSHIFSKIKFSLLV